MEKIPRSASSMSRNTPATFLGYISKIDGKQNLKGKEWLKFIRTFQPSWCK